MNPNKVAVLCLCALFSICFFFSAFPLLFYIYVLLSVPHTQTQKNPTTIVHPFKNHDLFRASLQLCQGSNHLMRLVLFTQQNHGKKCIYRHNMHSLCKGFLSKVEIADTVYTAHNNECQLMKAAFGTATEDLPLKNKIDHKIHTRNRLRTKEIGCTICTEQFRGYVMWSISNIRTQISIEFVPNITNVDMFI